MSDAAEEIDPATAATREESQSKGWLGRLSFGLSRTSERISGGIADIFQGRLLDDETLEELEELLIMADLGTENAARLTTDLAKARFGANVTELEVREFLAKGIAEMLAPYAKPMPIDRYRRPFVILVVGVNGSGKTTTIGKYAMALVEGEDLRVTLAAADTFRAAAIEQLTIWGERVGAEVIAGEQGSDAAALAYEALEKASEAREDLLFIDTAGRLQNKKNLMDELAKIVRVMKKIDESTPHEVLLVLDATVGQNAISQVEIFREVVNVTGLIVTKLDGTAKGGVLVGLAQKFELPIYAIGVGEKAEDLRPFEARDFARSLLGLDAYDAAVAAGKV